MVKIAKALQDTSTLTVFSINNNRIGDTGRNPKFPGQGNTMKCA